MSRHEIVKKAVFDALGNAALTTAGLVQSVHNAHPDIKHAAHVMQKDNGEFTIWVKYHDRSTDAFGFVRAS